MENFDLFEYAEKNDIMIEYGDLEKNKALSVKIGQDEYIGIDKSVAADSAEERTLLAHEIGHLATGAIYDFNASLAERRRMERKAVKWSLLYCVPKRDLETLIKQGYHRYEIAELFGVTEQFIKQAFTFYFDVAV